MYYTTVFARALGLIIFVITLGANSTALSAQADPVFTDVFGPSGSTEQLDLLIETPLSGGYLATAVYEDEATSIVSARIFKLDEDGNEIWQVDLPGATGKLPRIAAALETGPNTYRLVYLERTPTIRIGRLSQAFLTGSAGEVPTVTTNALNLPADLNYIPEAVTGIPNSSDLVIAGSSATLDDPLANTAFAARVDVTGTVVWSNLSLFDEQGETVDAIVASVLATDESVFVTDGNFTAYELDDMNGGQLGQVSLRPFFDGFSGPNGLFPEGEQIYWVAFAGSRYLVATLDEGGVNVIDDSTFTDIFSLSTVPLDVRTTQDSLFVYAEDRQMGPSVVRIALSLSSGEPATIDRVLTAPQDRFSNINGIDNLRRGVALEDGRLLIAGQVVVPTGGDAGLINVVDFRTETAAPFFSFDQGTNPFGGNLQEVVPKLDGGYYVIYRVGNQYLLRNVGPDGTVISESAISLDINRLLGATLSSSGQPLIIAEVGNSGGFENTIEYFTLNDQGETLSRLPTNVRPGSVLGNFRSAGLVKAADGTIIFYFTNIENGSPWSVSILTLDEEDQTPLISDFLIGDLGFPDIYGLLPSLDGETLYAYGNSLELQAGLYVAKINLEVGIEWISTFSGRDIIGIGEEEENILVNFRDSVITLDSDGRVLRTEPSDIDPALSLGANVTTSTNELTTLNRFLDVSGDGLVQLGGTVGVFSDGMTTSRGATEVNFIPFFYRETDSRSYLAGVLSNGMSNRLFVTVFDGVLSPVTTISEVKSLRTYPNPVSSGSNLQLEGADLPATLQLYSTAGQNLGQLSVDDNSVRLPSLAAGAYWLRGQAAGRVYLARVVVW